MDEWKEQRSLIRQKTCKVGYTINTLTENQFPLPPDNHSIIIVLSIQTCITTKDLYYNIDKIQHRRLGRSVAFTKLKQIISQIELESEDSNFVSISLKQDEIQGRVMKHKLAYDKMIQNDRIRCLEANSAGGIEEDIPFGEIQTDKELESKVTFVIKLEDQHKLKSEFNQQTLKIRSKYKNYRILENPHTANSAMSDHSSKSFLSSQAARSEGYYSHHACIPIDHNRLNRQKSDEINENRDLSELRTSSRSRSKSNDGNKSIRFLQKINSPYQDAQTTSSSSPVVPPRYIIRTDSRDSCLPPRLINQISDSLTVDYDSRSHTPLSKYSFQNDRGIITEDEDRSSPAEQILKSNSKFWRDSCDVTRNRHLMNIVSETSESQQIIPDAEIQTIIPTTFRRSADKSFIQVNKKFDYRYLNVANNSKNEVSSVYNSTKKETLPMINISRVTKRLTPRVK